MLVLIVFFIDLEILGKVTRQGHLDTVISDHSIDDIYAVKSIINNSFLLVRVNPINSNSQQEIENVIESWSRYNYAPNV